MKHKTGRFIGSMLSACILFSAVTAYIPHLSDEFQTSAAQVDWGSYLKKDSSWFGSSEGTAFADEILQYQLSDGGWRKDMANTSVTGSWAKSTIDNESTTSQIIVLARVYNATGTDKYKNGCLKGIDCLIDAQYDNGGWPQVFNDAGTYHAHITFNDTAMINVMNVLQDVAAESGDFGFVDSSRRQEAQTAVDKGIDCILKCQIEIDGKLTAWGQQHDEYTLEPTSARAYELPSLCTSESVGIVEFLRSLPEKNNDIIRSINAAVEWFDDVKLTGIKFVEQDGDKVVIEDSSASPLWARFYDLENIQPLFSDRDGQAYTDVSQISQERRTGYAWYGTWPAKSIQLGTLPLIEETPAEPITGTLIKTVVPDDNALPDLWSVDTDIQLGDKLYNDREVTYAVLPDELVGAEAVVTPCDGKKIDGDLAELTAAEDITVFIVHDSRVANLPSWLSDWQLWDVTAANSDGIEYNLYSKDVKADETITLGTNGQSTGCTGYAVIAAKTGTRLISDRLPGDTDSSKTVNIFDLTLMKMHIGGNTELTGTAFENADVTGDKLVDVQDVKLLQEWLAGKDVTLKSYGSEVVEEEPVITNSYESADFEFSGKVFVVGDSTVCNYTDAVMNAQNRCGWGMKLADNYDNVTVTNLALSGRSSRSFLNDSNYSTLCNNISKGDYLFIQFGHNDEKTDDADRSTYPGLDFSTLDSEGKNSSGQYSYEWYILNKYVKVAQNKGAAAVIVTPITRRSSNGTANYKSHTEYSNALIQLGKDYNIPVIDMTALTTELYTELYNNGGADATAEMHCYTDDTQSTIDNTHLSIKGATIIASMIAEQTGVLELKISQNLK